MTLDQSLTNRVRAYRLAGGLSQEEVARRAGISRAGISAIEMGRLVPSTAAALALAEVFGCRVEDLFALASGKTDRVWAWPPPALPCRYWLAEVGGRQLAYPVESTELGAIPHDGVFDDGRFHDRPDAGDRASLVVASCDPAIALLADRLRDAGVRLVALQRSSRESLALLEKRLVHAAGIHLARRGQRGGNAKFVREQIGDAYRLVHVACWEAGIATPARMGLNSLNSMLKAKLRWVGRESGSAARVWLDELLEGRRGPRRLAHTHRGVAEAIRCGWADAGVCHRLASAEAGLAFCRLDEEAYDVCFPAKLENHPAVRLLIDAIRSSAYHELLNGTPGMRTMDCGEIEEIR